MKDLMIDDLSRIIERSSMMFSDGPNTHVLSANFESLDFVEVMKNVINYMREYGVEKISVTYVIFFPDTDSVKTIYSDYTYQNLLDYDDNDYKRIGNVFIETDSNFIFAEEVRENEKPVYLIINKRENKWRVYYSHQTEYSSLSSGPSGSFFGRHFDSLSKYVHRVNTTLFSKKLKVYNNNIIKEYMTMLPPPSLILTTSLVSKIAEIIKSENKPKDFNFYCERRERGIDPEEFSYPEEFTLGHMDFKDHNVDEVKDELYRFFIPGYDTLKQAELDKSIDGLDKYLNLSLSINRDIQRVWLSRHVCYSPVINKSDSVSEPLFWEFTYHVFNTL